MTPPSPPVLTVGIDLGSESTKAILGPSLDYELVPNSMGGHATPSSITFRGRSRLIGEQAAESKSADANTVLHLPRLLPGMGAGSPDDPFREFYRFELEDGDGDDCGPSASVEYDGSARSLSPPALLAALLGRVRSHVEAAVDRRASGGDSPVGPGRRYVLALPPGCSAAARSALADAARAAGLGDGAAVEDSGRCAAAAYGRKWAADGAGGRRIVAVVDMGHAQTTVSVLRMGGGGGEGSGGGGAEAVDTEEAADPASPDSAMDEKKEDAEGGAEATAAVTVLSSASRGSLGAGSVDIRLWRHFQSTVLGLSDLKPNSRRGQRLLEGCRKLKHLLSMLPSGSVTVETLGANDNDVNLTLTREVLQDLCKAEAEALSVLIAEALERADGVGAGKDVDSVEVLGGGCRIPFVQEAILKAMGRDPSEEGLLSRGLDDTSLALGAAALGDREVGRSLVATSDDKMEIDDDAVATDSERRSRLIETERAMAELDAEMAQRSEARNKIEAHVLEMRSARHGKHGSLLPDTATLDPYLDELDDWLFSDECEGFGVAEMESKLAAVLEKTGEMCKEYFDAVRKEAEAKEKEMEEEAIKAAAEREAEGGDGDEDDHDNRRLPKKRRMEIVMKNKNEANELLKDGNYRHAAARYAKALSHCAKFYDLTPEDKEDVDAVKLSLHLNMSLAYIKLEKPDNALRSCNDAIDLDPSNVKALYRRATIYYEKSKWEDCARDLKKASEGAPEDKSVKKLEARLEQQVKRQKAKEKKMAKKMFG